MELRIGEQMRIVECIKHEKAEAGQPQQCKTDPDERRQQLDQLDIEAVDAPAQKQRRQTEIEDQHGADREGDADKMREQQRRLGHGNNLPVRDPSQ